MHADNTREPVIFTSCLGFELTTPSVCGLGCVKEGKGDQGTAGADLRKKKIKIIVIGLLIVVIMIMILTIV